jgi:hypothetical protein
MLEVNAQTNVRTKRSHETAMDFRAVVMENFVGSAGREAREKTVNPPKRETLMRIARYPCRVLHTSSSTVDSTSCGRS